VITNHYSTTQYNEECLREKTDSHMKSKLAIKINNLKKLNKDESHENATCSVSVNVTMAGVTRSPESFATTSALSSYIIKQTKTIMQTRWLYSVE